MMTRLVAALAAVAAIGAVSAYEPALADGMSSRPVKAVKHQTRHSAVYTYVRGSWPGGPDPYSYSYARRGYYPYYDSNYWVPREQMAGRTRYPLRIPEYFSSWGYPLSCKVRGGRHCGVPFVRRAGDPGHYYRRDVQLDRRAHQD